MELIQHDLRSGDVLFRENDPGRTLFMLIDGSLEVLQGGRQIAIIDTPGSFIGEMSTLLDQPRTSTVRALRHSSLKEVTEIERFFETEPKLTYKMALLLAARLQEMNYRFRKIKDQLDGWNLAESASLNEDSMTVIQGLLSELEGEAARS